MSLLAGFLGVPLTGEERALTLKTIVSDRSGADAIDHMRTAVHHNTEKAGALLAAQSVFAVAATFALDHGWPRIPVLLSILLLLVGSLLAMSILRSTVSMYGRKAVKTDPVQLVFDLLLSRMARFNTALNLTFVAIVLMIGAALAYFF
ncbi:MAG TPA: hypothetical protein VGG10_12455 [Rhizomicrobium sp.]|jgi:hypothetical protein